MGRRQKLKGFSFKVKNTLWFWFSPETGSSLPTREPRSLQRVCYALVVAVSLGFAFLSWKKSQAHTKLRRNIKRWKPTWFPLSFTKFWLLYIFQILLKGNKLYFLFLFSTMGIKVKRRTPWGILASVSSVSASVWGRARLLEPCRGQPPVFPRARYAVRTFGSRRDEPTAACGAKMKGIPDRGLGLQEYELRKNSFFDPGNFGFGIQEHIDLGIRYDASMGVCATWTPVQCRLVQASASDKITQEGQDGLHGGQMRNQQRGGPALAPAEVWWDCPPWLMNSCVYPKAKTNFSVEKKVIADNPMYFLRSSLFSSPR